MQQTVSANAVKLPIFGQHLHGRKIRSFVRWSLSDTKRNRILNIDDKVHPPFASCITQSGMSNMWK